MRTVLLLVVLVFIAFVVWNRQRLFVRDPLAKVTRNHYVEDGAQVYINFRNDILIENDNQPMYVEVIEHNNHTGAPATLHCIHYVACLLDADFPALSPWPLGIQVQSMDSKSVVFREGRSWTEVTLR